MIIPTTTVTVLRTDEDDPPRDAWGDPLDSDTVPAGGAALPATREGTRRRTLDPASGQMQVTTEWGFQLDPGVFAFVETDRVRDDLTGEVFQVEDVDQSPSGLMQGVINLRCTLVR